QKKYALENISQASFERGLRIAATNNYVGDIKDLLDSLHVNINAQDNEDKKTALHHAVINGHIESITALLTRKAQWDIEDSSHKTAVDYAKEQSNPYIFFILAKNIVPWILKKYQTASEEVVPSNEEALRRALIAENVLDLELLIESEVDIDLQD